LLILTKKKEKKKKVLTSFIDRNRFPSFLGARRIGSQFSDGLFVDFIRSAPASHPEHLPIASISLAPDLSSFFFRFCAGILMKICSASSAPVGE
jgi:hypothetical protein